MMGGIVRYNLSNHKALALVKKKKKKKKRLNSPAGISSDRNQVNTVGKLDAHVSIDNRFIPWR